ncbi:phage head closure protein [Alkaliphilus sp. B6464]|uniref:phage head closure protein n=1 Tax=Alkaliphilus sp. B6464 TaxID=2731219 RepID=UPI001BA83D38|nr:phage head closure protein [Alkaliphilus sp. B6464]QUH21081.1 phage head closure protein [Alkaliphilus sp. B6464]
MNPGKLNKRITIYKDTDKQDDYGEPLDKKIVLHKCWASIKNKSGTEQFKADTPFSKVITSFLIRYTRKVIDTTMKIEFKNETYNIIYVDNYNFSNECIEITAEKVS